MTNPDAPQGPHTPPTTRREAVIRLAQSIRALGDAAAETDIDVAAIDEAARQIDAIRDRLAAAINDGAYSGLRAETVDFTVPDGPMPLNPIIGLCSPVRPDVSLAFVDGRVEGTATFSKRFVGPPGFVHGGITAMLCDQLVASSPGALQLRCITKSLSIRYRKPVPINQAIRVVGVCTPTDDAITSTAQIFVDDKLAVEATGEVVSVDKLLGDRPVVR